MVVEMPLASPRAKRLPCSSSARTPSLLASTKGALGDAGRALGGEGGSLLGGQLTRAEEGLLPRGRGTRLFAPPAWPSFPDVIGVCKSYEDPQKITIKASNREVSKRELHLMDMSGKTVTVTLWGADVSSGGAGALLLPNQAGLGGSSHPRRRWGPGQEGPGPPVWSTKIQALRRGRGRGETSSLTPVALKEPPCLWP